MKNGLNILEKCRTLSSKNRFLLMLLFNALFFCLLAYLLPIRFEENDDVTMCMIANGAYSGTPDAHLVFINYLYGWILTVFYNIFSGIEWYSLFFSIIHIVSLTVIVFSILRKTDRPIWLKIVFLFLLYVIEIRIILMFQFTTTAAIGSFAGLLLLLETKKRYNILGVFLFLIGALIRFDAAILVLLLTLPIFGYFVLFNKNKVVKMLIFVAICICGAFSAKIIDSQIYAKNQEWSYYKEYNEIRGQINDNPNAKQIIDDLPEEISENDYRLFLAFFADGEIIDLPKAKQLNDLIKNVPFTQKIKNIYPSLRGYTSVLGLVVLLFILSILAEKQRKKKIYALFYLLFFTGILSYISMEGILKYRVFTAALFPALFFLYCNTHIFNRLLKILYAGMAVALALLLLYRTYNIREYKSECDKMAIAGNLTLLNNVQDKDINIIQLSADLSSESLCSPFSINKTFSKYSILGCSGWTVAIPLNKGRFESYRSLIDNDIYLFASTESAEWYIPRIKKSLIENYNIATESVVKFGKGNSLLIQIKTII